MSDLPKPVARRRASPTHSPAGSVPRPWGDGHDRKAARRVRRRLLVQRPPESVSAAGVRVDQEPGDVSRASIARDRTGPLRPSTPTPHRRPRPLGGCRRHDGLPATPAPTYQASDTSIGTYPTPKDDPSRRSAPSGTTSRSASPALSRNWTERATLVVTSRTGPGGALSRGASRPALTRRPFSGCCVASAPVFSGSPHRGGRWMDPPP